MANFKVYIIGLLQDFILKIFYRNMYVIKDESDHFEEKFAKITHIFL
jgi:hypothetical protein